MSPQRPLLVHVHLPKTAGQSVMNLLWCALGQGVIHIDYATDPAGTGAEEAPDLDHVRDLLDAVPDAAAITSHCFRFEHPEQLGGRPVFYAAFLREPLEQTRSWVRYLKANFATFSPVQRRFLELPDDLEQRSLVEIAQRMIDQFVVPVGRGAGGFWFLPGAFFGCHGDAAATLEILRRFAFVGVTEDLAGGLRLLQAKLATAGLSLELPPAPRVNVSPREGDEARALDEFGPLREFIEEQAAADVAVYAWAKERFERELRSEQLA